jgi:tRNA nucleotidyltransferase (CCA-adding enzyme)
MKVYLVGGAVRDQFLGYPVRERDWVVVGATPELLLQKGYQQVGRDFPVFLHPMTREEYALARTERKQGSGYYGFSCDFNPHVTLEEDLRRRDLTINAMAMDESGHLIDPFNGLDDLKKRCLRHVSDAFVEDPVRVLRVARFAARYHHLGFTLADETRCLMVEMVKQGELAHLVPERVWQEWASSLGEKNPEQFILVMRGCGALSVVIPELDRLFGIPISVADYPLIDTGIQAIESLTKMAAISEEPPLRFAALCRHLAYTSTPMKSWPKHQPTATQIQTHISSLCHRLRIPKEYMQLAQMTAQFYSVLQQLPQLDAETIVSIFERCDAFRRPEIFKQVLMIADAIRLDSSAQYATNWLKMLNICGTISAQSLIDQGYQGEAIKKGLHQKRVAAIEDDFGK